MKKIILLIFFAFLLMQFSRIPPVSAKEEVIGEIININYKYKIAFTDLNNYHLQPGDIVEIYKDNQFLTYLEVSESSSAISKLISLKDKGEYDTGVKFSDIRIGYKVLKVHEDKFTTPQRVQALEAIKTESGKHVGAATSSDQIQTVVVEDSGDTKEAITKKYNMLLEKHTDIVKSLITIKAEKQLLKSNNELLTNEIMSSGEEIKNLKMKMVKLESELAHLKQKINEDTCQIQLEQSFNTVNTLKDKLQKIQKYIEGKK